MQRGLSLLKLNYRSFSRIRQRGTSIEEKFGIISQEAKESGTKLAIFESLTREIYCLSIRLGTKIEQR